MKGLEIFETLIGGLIGGGLIGFIQFMITRNDAKKEKDSVVMKELKSIAEKILGIESRLDMENADDARRSILSFDDELRRCMDHSEESFNQVLDDINLYTRYCRDNPAYENNKASAAIAHIKETYQRVKAEDKFI